MIAARLIILSIFASTPNLRSPRRTQIIHIFRSQERSTNLNSTQQYTKGRKHRTIGGSSFSLNTPPKLHMLHKYFTCNSASISLGLHEWKAPDAIKRIKLVSMLPCRVDTLDPSIMGSRSLCTPSALASADRRSPTLQIYKKARLQRKANGGVRAFQ